jgi:hypothetical protein
MFDKININGLIIKIIRFSCRKSEAQKKLFNKVDLLLLYRSMLLSGIEEGHIMMLFVL